MAFFINVLIIAAVMWWFFRYMYPKPPATFFAKADDDTSIRHCDHCQTPLATYRGILIPKSLPPSTPEAWVSYPFIKDEDHTILDDCYFFCNDEHQSAYVASLSKDQAENPSKTSQPKAMGGVNRLIDDKIRKAETQFDESRAICESNHDLCKKK